MIQNIGHYYYSKSLNGYRLEKIVNTSGGCTDISKSGLNALFENCTLICKLVLDGCSDVTDTTIDNLTTRCRAIEILSLQACNKSERASSAAPSPGNEVQLHPSPATAASGEEQGGKRISSLG